MTAYRTLEDHGRLTVTVNFKATPEMAADIDELAKADGRSRSDYLRRMIRPAIEKLKAAESPAEMIRSMAPPSDPI